MWLKIGMAMRSRFGEDGYELWRAWSATGHTYPGAEVARAKWDSFAKQGDDRHGRAQAKIDTIFFFAKLHGWPNGPVPQWDLAPSGPQIAPAAGSRDGKPITVPDMPSPASGPATAAVSATEAAAAREAQPQAAKHWLDTPNPFAASTPAGASAKFPLIRYRDIVPVLTNQWLIKGLLPSRGLCIVYGQPGCGKSFLTLHAMLHVAAGKAYAGRRVRQARVVYIAAEGQGGFRKRVHAAGRALALNEGLTV